jgi:KaiC/GvpD/RAD55 family RecA-like ATPase
MDFKIKTISDIALEPVEWLAKPFLPRGKLVNLIGDPGVGKTSVALSIAAAVSRGEKLPWDMSDAPPLPPSDTLFQSTEDGYGDTIRPRLEQLGADCTRIHCVDESTQPLSLDDPRIERAIVEKHAVLAIFDPLQSYLNGGDMSGTASVRPILTQLSEAAKRTNCTILLISHLNKKGGKSLYRGLGSIDITAVARSVIAVGKMPGDDELRALVHAKSNLAPLGESQGFGFDEDAGLTWLGPADITLDQLFDDKPPKNGVNVDVATALDAAISFLREELKNGALPSTQVIADANAKGISERTLKRAKQSLGVKSVQVKGGWLWAEPSIASGPPCQTDTESHTCELGTVRLVTPRGALEIQG